MNVHRNYTAVVKRDGEWWIEEAPGVNRQKSAREELVTTPRATASRSAPRHESPRYDFSKARPNPYVKRTKRPGSEGRSFGHGPPRD